MTNKQFLLGLLCIGSLWLPLACKSNTNPITSGSMVPVAEPTRSTPPTPLVLGQSYSGSYATQVCVSGSGDIDVLDYDKDAINIYSASGMAVTSWSGFAYPSDMALGPAGNIYVTDSYNDRIEKYTPQGKLFWTSSGHGIFYPLGVSVNASDQVEVSDYIGGSGYGVLQLNPRTGVVLKQWPGTSRQNVFYGIALSNQGEVYVSDHSTEAINEYTSNGVLLKTIPTSARYLVGITLNNENTDIYYADYDGKISEIDLATDQVIHTSIALYAWQISVDGKGNVWTYDDNNNSIIELNPDLSLKSWIKLP
jgi:streptogramin lyase